MANIYTQFSVIVPWQGPARPALLAKLRESDDPGRLSPPCEFEDQPEGIWLYSEDTCDLNGLVAILAEVQSGFGLPPFGFEFSVSCSRPVLDEFGGGAVFLKDGEATWLNTSSWLAERLAAARSPTSPS
jgi:hypothetical protein